MNIVDFDDDVVAAESTGAAPDKADFEDGVAVTFTIVRVDRKTFKAGTAIPRRPSAC